METNYKSFLCVIPKEKEEDFKKLMTDSIYVECDETIALRDIVEKAVEEKNMDFIEQLIEKDLTNQDKTIILSEISKKECFFPIVQKLLQEEWDQKELASILSRITSFYSPSVKMEFLKKGAGKDLSHSDWHSLLVSAASEEFNIELVEYILEEAPKYDKLNIDSYDAAVAFYLIIENYNNNIKELRQKKHMMLKLLLQKYGNALFFTKSEFKEHDKYLRGNLLMFLLLDNQIPRGCIADNDLIRWANNEFDEMNFDNFVKTD